MDCSEARFEILNNRLKERSNVEIVVIRNEERPDGHGGIVDREVRKEPQTVEMAKRLGGGSIDDTAQIQESDWRIRAGPDVDLERNDLIEVEIDGEKFRLVIQFKYAITRGDKIMGYYLQATETMEDEGVGSYG